MVVWASLDRSHWPRRNQIFRSGKGTPGMQLVRLEKNPGIKASDTAAITFTNCRVPAANLLG